MYTIHNNMQLLNDYGALRALNIGQTFSLKDLELLGIDDIVRHEEDHIQDQLSNSNSALLS